MNTSLKRPVRSQKELTKLWTSRSNRYNRNTWAIVLNRTTKLYFVSVSASDPCGSPFINISTGNSSYTLTSPWYSITDALLCTWYVTADNGTRVFVEFIDFLLWGDHLFTVGYGHNTTDLRSQLMSRRGTTTPREIVSRDNLMWIEFRRSADGHDGAGLKALFNVLIKSFPDPGTF